MEKNDIEIVEKVEAEVETDVDTEVETDTTDWKAEAIKLREKARAQRETTKELKAKVAEFEKKPQDNKSDDFDYKELTLKSYLKSEGVIHPDDQKVVKDEAARLKLPIDEVLGMEHIKSKLQAIKESRESQEAMPKGKGRTGSTTPNDVEYHLAKGTTPDDQELAEKVVNARLARETKSKMFSDTLYDG